MGTDVTRYFVQTTSRLHRIYGAWVGAMRGTNVCLRRQSLTTKDTLGNALFLWARAQPPEKLAEMLEPYMNEFDRIWTSREATESPGQPWLPGSVRDQTAVDEQARKAALVNETKVNPDRPDRKPGKRRGAS